MDIKKFKKVSELVSKIEEVNNNLNQLEGVDGDCYQITITKGRSYYDTYINFYKNKELKKMIVDNIKSILKEKKCELEKELEEA
jgi:hypothetical protein